MDIIITTPKNEIETSDKELEYVKNNNDAYFFRIFKTKPNVEIGDKVYEVENGYIVGYGIIFDLIKDENGLNEICDTTGRKWEGKCMIKYKDWNYIEPIQMKGFQGYRYAEKYLK